MKCESTPKRLSIRRWGPACTRDAWWHVRRVSDGYEWNLCGNHAAWPKKMGDAFVVTAMAPSR